MNGKLIFQYATMNAGKTAKLLTEAYNLMAIGKNVTLIKPSLDTRTETIESRNGFKSDCLILNETQNVSDILPFDDYKDKYILVDECQFLSKKQIFDLRKISLKGATVECFGLKNTFKMELFESSAFLLAIADEIVENSSYCHCGEKATMILKTDSDSNPIYYGDIIDCGAEDKYTSVCFKHYTNETNDTQLSDIFRNLG